MFDCPTKRLSPSKLQKSSTPHSNPVREIFAKMGHFDTVRSVMVFYWLFYKAVLQKDTGDASLAHIGVNVPENVPRNGNVVYLPTFSGSNKWDFCLLPKMSQWLPKICYFQSVPNVKCCLKCLIMKIFWQTLSMSEAINKKCDIFSVRCDTFQTQSQH